MRKLSLFALLLILTSMLAGVAQAQDEPSVFRLLAEDAGNTFHVMTGTVIEVRLSFSELYVSYDPTRLRFLDYRLPAGLTGTVESGVIAPEGVAPGIAQPGTILPNEGQPGLPPSPGTTLPTGSEPGAQPTEMPPEIPIAGGGSSASVVTVVPGGVITPGGAGIEESYTLWRFLAIGSGRTSLELLTFRPPCSMDQPCVMMPDFLVSFNLVIEGNTVVPEPERINGEVIVVRPQAVEPTINVQAGQVVRLDVSELERPFPVIYHPGAVRLLEGGNLRFLVNPWGMMTRMGVRTADGSLLAVTLLIEPECESCGVLPMPAGQ